MRSYHQSVKYFSKFEEYGLLSEEVENVLLYHSSHFQYFADRAILNERGWFREELISLSLPKWLTFLSSRVFIFLEKKKISNLAESLPLRGPLFPWDNMGPSTLCLHEIKLTAKRNWRKTIQNMRKSYHWRGKAVGRWPQPWTLKMPSWSWLFLCKLYEIHFYNIEAFS